MCRQELTKIISQKNLGVILKILWRSKSENKSFISYPHKHTKGRLRLETCPFFLVVTFFMFTFAITGCVGNKPGSTGRVGGEQSLCLAVYQGKRRKSLHRRTMFVQSFWLLTVDLQ